LPALIHQSANRGSLWDKAKYPKEAIDISGELSISWRVVEVEDNSFFKEYFIRRKKEGISPQKALFAVTHKLIRLIFAMLTNRTYFNPKDAYCG
jgi:hypothetical protein